MEFLKAITTDGDTVYFAVSKILTITPRKCGDVTILLGGGLYWHINPDSLEYVDLNEVMREVKK